jgi:chemotaxis protein MotB
VRLSSELLFAEGRARITRGGRQALSELAKVIQKTPSERVQVNGHTDSTPTTKAWEDNWQLSLARARGVVLYLISQGVDPKRLVAAGFGDTDPVVDGDTPQARAKNRRVELFIEPRVEPRAERSAAP